jgi:hypothetical protein
MGIAIAIRNLGRHGKTTTTSKSLSIPLLTGKPTWSLTAQSILFAAYGLTVTKDAPPASEFRLAVAVSGLVVAALTLIGVSGLIVSKLASYRSYKSYFDGEHSLPQPKKNKGNQLKWGPAVALLAR